MPDYRNKSLSLFEKKPLEIENNFKNIYISKRYTDARIVKSAYWN